VQERKQLWREGEQLEFRVIKREIERYREGEQLCPMCYVPKI